MSLLTDYNSVGVCSGHSVDPCRVNIKRIKKIKLVSKIRAIEKKPQQHLHGAEREQKYKVAAKESAVQLVTTWWVGGWVRDGSRQRK